jgi:hypothetical protein
MRILLPRLSLYPYIELPRLMAGVCAELAPCFTVHIAFALFPLSANIGLAGHGLVWEACRRPSFFILMKSHDLWHGADAAMHGLVYV